MLLVLRVIAWPWALTVEPQISVWPNVRRRLPTPACCRPKALKSARRFRGRDLRRGAAGARRSELLARATLAGAGARPSRRRSAVHR